MTNTDSLNANANSAISTLRTLGQITLPIALLSAIGYFCGYQAQALYLVSFGIPESLVKTDPAYLIGLGWFEIAITVLAVAVVVSVQGWVTNLPPHLTPRARTSIALIFSLSWVLAFLILPVFLGFLYIQFLRGYKFLFGLGVWLISLMLCGLLGNDICKRIGEYQSSKLRLVFRFIYPNVVLFLVLMGLVWFLFVSTESGLRGIRLAQRDQGPDSRLSKISLTSERALAISNQYVNAMNQYVSEDARLVAMNDKLIFVSTGSFISNPITSTTFAIPLDSIIIMDVRPWWFQ